MSAPTVPVLHIAWAQLLLTSLAHAGVRDVVVSPGSRSTPLALAAHESDHLRSWFIVDERSAAFFALGQARATGRPTALVCTSGTAAAHYYPAIIEASLSGLPMIVITADRPWELQQAGAAQTIDQTRLFGAFTRLFAALGAPEPTEAALRAVARTAAHAAARALGPEPGPVHINAPFRKPLEPATAPLAEPWHAVWTALLQQGPTRAVDPPRTLDPASLDATLHLVSTARRGLIALGPAPAHGDLDTLRREVLALSRATGFPILPEAPSQLRFGLTAPSLATAPPASTAAPASSAALAPLPTPDSTPVVVSTFDALFRSRSLRAHLAPDLILELGAPPTSTGYSQLLAERPGTPRVVVSPVGWTDPGSSAAVLVHAPVVAFCAALRARLSAAPSGPHTPHSDLARSTAVAGAGPTVTDSRAHFAATVAAADARARAIIESSFPPAPGAPGAPGAPPTPTLTEAATARAVVDACPAGSFLVLGNSSPVRDVDTFVFASSKPLRVLHQRGASGIDGLVSGAAGAQAASEEPVTLLLGDVSLVHDLGGLALARAATGPLAIVVVDNGGGRIFEQLPIGRALGPGPTFERCFATPQTVDFAAAAATFGIPFARAATPTELAAALSRAHAHAGATLIEAVVPPHDGAERNKAVWTRVDESQPPSPEPVSPQPVSSQPPSPSLREQSRKDQVS